MLISVSRPLRQCCPKIFLWPAWSQGVLLPSQQNDTYLSIAFVSFQTAWLSGAGLSRGAHPVEWHRVSNLGCWFSNWLAQHLNHGATAPLCLGRSATETGSINKQTLKLRVISIEIIPKGPSGMASPLAGFDLCLLTYDSFSWFFAALRLALVQCKCQSRTIQEEIWQKI